MKFQILGTAAAEGWPAVFCHCEACEEARRLGELRTRSQAVVDDDLLIDFPVDTYFHAVTRGIDLSGIKILLVTHSHCDHFAPLDLILRGDCYASSMRQEKLDIYFNAACREVFDSATQRELSAQVRDNLNLHVIHPFSEFTAGGYRIASLKADHAPNEEALLYLVEKEGKTLFFCTDTGILPEETFEFLKGRRIDLAVYDATFGPRKFGNGHMGIPDAAQVHERLGQIGCVDDSTLAVVTHFSHNCGAKSHRELEECAKQYGFLTAYDGFSIDI